MGRRLAAAASDSDSNAAKDEESFSALEPLLSAHEGGGLALPRVLNEEEGEEEEEEEGESSLGQGQKNDLCASSSPSSPLLPSRSFTDPSLPRDGGYAGEKEGQRVRLPPLSSRGDGCEGLTTLTLTSLTPLEEEERDELLLCDESKSQV